jgi:hypothetical protein
MIGAVTESVRICKARPALGKFEMVENRSFKAVTVKPARLK